MTPDPQRGFGSLVTGPGFWAAAWVTGELVVAVRVEGGLAEQFAGGGVDDPDVRVLDQEQDVGSGVVRPMPMWWRRPAWRSVTTPLVSMRSRRTRSWVSAERSPGAAMGRVV
jgi:hypothetical protein